VAKKDMVDQMAMEIAIHRSLVHPNITRFYDFTQDAKRIYYFLEYAPNGDLMEYTKKYRPSEPVLAQILYQVGDGLAYIHSHGFVHRDMKPENIIMDENHTPKIIDFGFATKIGPDGYCEDPMFCGTTDYMMYDLLSRFVHEGQKLNQKKRKPSRN
jgi:serine/threonine protein kinase